MAIVNGFPLKIAWDNKLDDTPTVITSNSARTSLPVQNIVNQQISKVWRSTGVTQTVNLSFDLGSAKSIQLFFLRNHNITSSGTVTLLGATNSSFSPAAVTLGLTITEDLIVGEFDSAQSYRYWRVNISNPSNSAGYVQAGHCYLGGYAEFGFPDRATVIRTVDPSIASRSFDGAATYYNRSKFRVVEFGLDMVQQSDRRTMETIFDAVGVGKGVYLLLDPENNRDYEDPSSGLDGKHRFTIFGTFIGQMSVSHFSLDWHSFDTLVFEELR